MTRLEFWIPGKPAGYDRAAAALRWTPKHVAEWREKVSAVYRQAAPKGWPTEGEYTHRVGLFVDAYGTHADSDNLVKEVMDALSGVAYCDDSQVIKHACTIHGRELTPRGRARKYKAGRQGLLVTLDLPDLKGAA